MADRVIRAALAALAVVGLSSGLWAEFSPRSFYDEFPGGGRAWVAANGPYNEHLVRDFGALIGDAVGFALGAALGRVTASGIWWSAFRQLVRRPATGAPPGPGVDAVPVGVIAAHDGE